jgi:hypothetical protein
MERQDKHSQRTLCPILIAAPPMVGAYARGAWTLGAALDQRSSFLNTTLTGISVGSAFPPPAGAATARLKQPGGSSFEVRA